MRVVHYLNQFFGGIGGEDKADTPLEVRPGAVGPGRALEQVLPEGAEIVGTIICGDNFAAEHTEEITRQVVRQVEEWKADLFLAGPCFEAGRYGTAAGALCAAVQTQLGIPAVSGMAVENPGVDLYKHEVYIVDSGQNAANMREAVAGMARLGSKLVNKETVGRPSEEGYIPQGILRSEFVEETAAQRLAVMLLAKLNGEPFEAEVPINPAEPVPMPPPVADLSKATVALVTDGGLVPKGNPDKLPRAFSKVWGAYDISNQDDLKGEDYEVAHGGYDNRYVQEDPNRLVPVDVLREMEKSGEVGKLHNEFLSTTGNGNPLENSRRMGREMAERLKAAGVDSVILTST